MKKVLFTATVLSHIVHFHLPFIQHLKSKGYIVHVASKNDLEAQNVYGLGIADKVFNVCFERFPIKKSNIKAYKQLKEIINENYYDIIHCHTPVGGIITRLVAKGSREKGSKVIYTAHGFHFFKGASIFNWFLFYPLEKICSYFTDALITINKEDYKLAVEKMKAKKVYYVHGVGIDLNKFANVKIDIEYKKKDFYLPENAIIILSVGEVNKNKNHEVIIKALAKINNCNIHYFIAGKGELESHLTELANSLGISNQVHLLGYRNDIGELYKVADIFCFPSFREGLSVSLMEAMAAGLPCIVSNIRGNVDLIENSKGGFLLEPTNDKGFANAIAKLIENKVLMQEMGMFNSKRIEQFDLENVKQQMVKIYNKCI